MNKNYALEKFGRTKNHFCNDVENYVLLSGEDHFTVVDFARECVHDQEIDWALTEKMQKEFPKLPLFVKLMKKHNERLYWLYLINDGEEFTCLGLFEEKSLMLTVAISEFSKIFLSKDKNELIRLTFIKHLLESEFLKPFWENDTLIITEDTLPDLDSPRHVFDYLDKALKETKFKLNGN